MMHFSQAGTGLNEFCTSFSRVALYGNQIANGAGTRSGNGPTNQNPNRLFCTHDIKPGNFSVCSLIQVSGEINQEKDSQLRLPFRPKPTLKYSQKVHRRHGRTICIGVEFAPLGFSIIVLLDVVNSLFFKKIIV